MHVTEKTERTGVDIRVALSSKAKLRSSEVQVSADQSSFEPAMLPSAMGLRSMVKGALRRVARLFFKVAKPFVRPVAFRLRAYLLGPLRVETQQFQQRLAQDVESH